LKIVEYGKIKLRVELQVGFEFLPLVKSIVASLLFSNMTTEIEGPEIGRHNSMRSDSEKAIPSNEPLAEVLVDRPREKALLRKLDLHLIPIIMTLYLLSFLDRGNFFINYCLQTSNSLIHTSKYWKRKTLRFRSRSRP